ncbi:hypothetical protein H5410_019291 [Solanum commersonii]|uniref:Uncharacterized protein n=1 Tax=Solanum commersonii TaxID=4109 RepID=A0A9J6A594_SOLCO|nr:hypothetical protein H5410_019291 [Solanum commersonii]
MEDLNSMMKIAIQRRWLKGFRVGSRTERVLEIYHLLFADDTIVFCDATREQISLLRLVLVIFEAISGLKINWRKSNIFPINEVTQIQVLANILRCGVGKLPTVYLGLPLGVLNIRDNIIKKTENKLAMWKGQYLSLGGRKEHKGYNLVKWNIVQQSKEHGGMGVRNLKLQNNSLLKKWLWRYAEDRPTLWKNVIQQKYGQNAQWCTDESTDTFRNNLGKDIIFQVGNGQKIFFLKDNWDGQGTLQEAFPSIFNINTNQNSTIENIWTAQGCNLIFRRFLNDWEVERVVSLLGRIGTFIGTTNEPDIIKWRHNIDGKFSVNRVYKKGLVEMTERDRGPWKATWRSMAPTKVNASLGCLVPIHYLSWESWTMPEHTDDLLSCWIRMGRSKSWVRWWKTVLACIW